MKIFITGTSEGLGHEMARKFLTSGHHVTGLSRRPTSFENENYRHIPFDLTNCATTMPQELDTDCFDVVVLNAVHADFKKLQDQSTEEIEAMVRVNTLAPMLITQKILNNQNPNKDGTLFVYIGSESSYQPQSNLAVYAGSKIALASFAKAMAVELCATAHSFLNLVIGPIALPHYLEQYEKECQTLNLSIDEFIRTRMLAKYPGTTNAALVDPALVIETIEFIAKQKKSFNGSTIRLDHGTIGGL